MAHYWLPDATSGTGTGNWSATGATGHWADDAGGTALGKAAPGSGDNVFFGASAFNGAGQIVTIDAAASCLSMDWTGATNAPRINGVSTLIIYGNATYILAMEHRLDGALYYLGTGNITSNGTQVAYPGATIFAGTSHTFIDAYYAGGVQFQGGTLNTNGQSFRIVAFATNTLTGVLTLGASVLTVSSWALSANTPTLTANTSTINCSGNFSGGGLLTYWIVNLTGNACAMSGANTIYKLTRTGTAAASTWVLAGNQTVTDICTITGNSAVNTMTVSSSVAGTKRRILARKFVLTNVILSADIELGIYDAGSGTYALYTQPEAGVAPDTTTLQDGSRNQASGTMTAITWAQQPSKLWAMSFNGTTSKIVFPTSLNTVRSASMWIKPAANTRSIIDFDGGAHSLEISATNTLTALGWYNPTVYVNGVAGTALTLNAWNYVTVTTANGFTASAVVIGQEATFYSGLIALPRTFNYQLSAGQVYKNFESTRRGFAI